MKRILAIALLSTLVACSDGGSNDSVDVAKSAITSLSDARKILVSVNSVEDAQAAEANLASAGENYVAAVKSLSTLDKTDPEVMQRVAEITPALAAEYQGLILELNALQARNHKASEVLMDELKAFRSK